MLLNWRAKAVCQEVTRDKKLIQVELNSFLKSQDFCALQSGLIAPQETPMIWPQRLPSSSEVGHTVLRKRSKSLPTTPTDKHTIFRQQSATQALCAQPGKRHTPVL